jgi:hypothetical protein
LGSKLAGIFLNDASMMCKVLLVGGLLTLLISCGPPAGKDDTTTELIKSVADSSTQTAKADNATVSQLNGDEFVLENYLVHTDIDTSQLQTIDTTAALLVYPSDEQIETMKEEYGEENFYTVADDGNYYQGTAIGMIDSLNVPTVNAERPYVRFKADNQQWTLHVRGKNAPPWNIIFFKKGKKPAIISTVELQYEEIRKYFDL